jgi:hypothetical protein
VLVCAPAQERWLISKLKFIDVNREPENAT